MYAQRLIIVLFKVAAIISLFGIFLLMVVTIILRSFFSLGVPWVNELLVFFQVNLTFFTLPILFLDNQHLKVDFFINKFPLIVRKIINKLIILATITFGLIFIYSHYLYTKRSWNISTPNLSIPNSIYYLGSLIGMIFLVLFAINKLFTIHEGGD